MEVSSSISWRTGTTWVMTPKQSLISWRKDLFGWTSLHSWSKLVHSGLCTYIIQLYVALICTVFLILFLDPRCCSCTYINLYVSISLAGPWKMIERSGRWGRLMFSSCTMLKYFFRQLVTWMALIRMLQNCNMHRGTFCLHCTWPRDFPMRYVCQYF